MDKLYMIRYTEIYSDTYGIDANSYEEAIQKLEWSIKDGIWEGPDTCTGSRYELEEVIK